MKFCYGPVVSRRLGLSLGVDLTSDRYCSFDCVYCQVGATVNKGIKRVKYVDIYEFIDELKEFAASGQRVDYVTFAGSGEPTLHEDLDWYIRAVRGVLGDQVKICVITNSSLLYMKKVRDELAEADLIIPSLDAASQNIFEKINMPVNGQDIKRVIKGIVDLRKEFRGEIWLEIMLVKNLNDIEEEFENFKKVINKIKPDKVQINVPVRPPAKSVKPPAKKKIKQLMAMIGDDVEVICACSAVVMSEHDVIAAVSSDDVIDYVARRPAPIEEIAESFNVSDGQIYEIINKLIFEKTLIRYEHQGRTYIKCV